MKLPGLPAVLLVLVACAIVPSVLPTSRERQPERLTEFEQVDAQRCAECHAELVESLQTAPHWNTLLRGSSTLAAERFQGQARLGKNSFLIQQEKDSLSLQVEGKPGALPIDWVFGSGHHAQTPVSVLTSPAGRTEIVELGVTWYPKSGLGPTPGSDGLLTEPPPWPSHGMHHDNDGAVQCFGCHSTRLPVVDGQIDFRRIVTGVRCTRCHTQAAQHVKTIEDGELSLLRWSGLTPLESISRCGECHRRPDEFTSDEITPESKLIIRFAPVGLSQSRCFTAQDDRPSSRFDCMTCHDPHQPAATERAHYLSRCHRCHTGDSANRPACGLDSVAPDSTRCLDCHMPKVEANPWLSFTDHWIRIRSDLPDDSTEPATTEP